MHDLDTGTPRVRWILFAVAAVALAATLATCKSVTDNVLTPRAPATSASSCVSECAREANEELREESDLHVATVKACKGDTLCLANENARHQAAVNVIQAQRQQCQQNCHHQGSGNGGR